MTTPETIAYAPATIAWRRRIVTRAVVLVARVLAAQPPKRSTAVLSWVRGSVRPATYAHAQQARRTVVAVSYACTGPQGCLARSIATALLCRLVGTWPTWCVGVRRMPPFGAHAWVEAEDRAVDEPYPTGYYQLLLSVPAADHREALS